MADTEAKKFFHRPFFWVLFMAVAIRFLAWNLINVVSPFTIELIMYGAKANTSAILKEQYQEPFHPIILNLTHSMLFPHEFIGEVINTSSWELTSFLVGLVFTIICLWLLFEIGCHLHSPAAGLWAAFFMAVGYYAVNYSVMGLSESPYLALILLTIYLVLQSSPSRGFLLLLAGACSILSIMTRKEGILTLGAIPLYLFFQQKITLLQRFKQEGFFLAGFVVVGIGFWILGGRFCWLVPYLPPALQSHMQFLTLNTDPNSFFILAELSTSRLFKVLSFILFGWINMSGVLPALLCLAFIFKREKFSLRPGVALLFLYLAFHLSLLCANYYRHGNLDTRYLFPPAVIIFPVAGIVLAELFKQRIFWAGILTIILIGIYIPVNIHSFIRNRHPEITAAVQWIAANTPPETFIYTQDSRIGFYCRRPWDNFLYNPVNMYGITTQKPPTGSLFLALLYKKAEGPNLSYWLDFLKLTHTMKAERINVFTGPKNEVGLFKLSSKLPAGK